MRKILLVVAVVLAAVLLFGIAFSDHIWWATSRYSVTMNNQPATNDLTYAHGSTVYMKLPNELYDAYLIDFDKRDIAEAQINRFIRIGPLLICLDAPPWRVPFDKLELKKPQFSGNRVTFSTFTGQHVVVTRQTDR